MVRWEMSRRSAYQLIDAAVIYKNISENIIDGADENVAHGRKKIKILPANERQIRPLIALSPKQQQEAWNQVVSTAPNGKVTAVHVTSVVNEYRRKGAVLNKNSHIETLINTDSEQVRSCWNCSHCSKELPENPNSFYCNKLGELSLLEKNGNERGSECPHWSHRNTPAENKSSQTETFNLNIQLPSHLQPLIQDAARASGLVVNEWVAQAIEEALQQSGNG
jgi:predicted HicB family RNase H-like nuclease